MKEYAKKTGEMIQGGTNSMKSGLNQVGSLIKGKFGDLGGPKEGITVTITSDGPLAPNASYHPDAKDRSQNYNVDQALIDGVGTLGKGFRPPGSRGSNSPAVNPGEAQPETLPVGEAVNGVVGAAVPAAQAAQEVYKPAIEDSVIRVMSDTTNKNQTRRTATSRVTGESTSRIVNQPIEDVNY